MTAERSRKSASISRSDVSGGRHSEKLVPVCGQGGIRDTAIRGYSPDFMTDFRATALRRENITESIHGYGVPDCGRSPSRKEMKTEARPRCSNQACIVEV